MKFTVPRSTLLHAMAACASVAETNSPVAAYQCVFIEAIRAGEGGMKLRALSGHRSIAIVGEVSEVSAGGTVMLRCEDALARIQAMADGEIVVSADDRRAEFRQGSTRLSLSVFDPAGAPLPKTDSPVEWMTIGGASLSALLSRMAPSMCADISRPSHNGIWLRARNGQLTASTATGLSAARASADATGSIDAVLPGPAVPAVRKLFAKLGGDVRVGVAGSDLVFDGGNVVFRATLTGLPFPPVDVVTPPATGPVIRVPREALLSALETVRSVRPKDYRVTILGGDGGVTLVSIGPEGEGECTVGGDGCIQSVSVNGEALGQALNLFDGDEIEIWHPDSDKKARVLEGAPDPVTIRAPGAQDVFVIMPMRFAAEDLSASPSRAAA